MGNQIGHQRKLPNYEKGMFGYKLPNVAQIKTCRHSSQEYAMKLKCIDGKVRSFFISRNAEGRGPGSEAECKHCRKKFGVHDTRLLIPKFKEHVCPGSVDLLTHGTKVWHRTRKEHGTIDARMTSTDPTSCFVNFGEDTLEVSIALLEKAR